MSDLCGTAALSPPRPWLPLILLLLAIGMVLPVPAFAGAGNGADWKTMAARLQQLNQRILSDRTRLQSVSERYLASDEISEEDFNWLKGVAEEYGLEPRQRGDRNFFNALAVRVDAVPPSLALGIGWLEYGWRPVKTSCRPPCRRLLPPEDMYGWVHELNTADRYAAFRAARLDLRRRNQPLATRTLAPSLEPLTSEGPAYTKRLNDLVQRLRLDRWDPRP